MPREGAGIATSGVSILIFGDDSRYQANCVLDHLHALQLYSRHVVHLFNPIGLNACYSLDLDEYSVVAIHYSILITSDGQLSSGFREKLRRFAGLKVMFAMDEYRDVDRIAAMMRYIGIKVLFTCVPVPAVPTVYGDRLPGVQIVSVLTGYMPDRLLGTATPPPQERKIDIGYRGRSLPYWLGDLGQDKRRIGEGVLARAPRLGLTCDIDWTESGRIYGGAWDRRVASWRAALAVEAGSGIVDHDGSIQKRTEAFVSEQPNADFAAVRREVLGDVDGNVEFKVISSRVFEAIALRTALVMFPGHYSGVVQPETHYLALERDFSNFDKVAAALRDLHSLEEMIERAYRDVVASGLYSYRAFVKTVDAVLDRHLPAVSQRRFQARYQLARLERRSVRATANVAGNALRATVAASILVQDHELLLLAWRYFGAVRMRPKIKLRQALGDLLKLHVLRRAQLGGTQASMPFTVEARLLPGQVIFRSRPTGRPQRSVKSLLTASHRSVVEKAIREGRVATMSWDHSLVGDDALLPIGFRRTLRVAGGGVNSFHAMPRLAERFPAEAAAVLAPLFVVQWAGEDRPESSARIRSGLR